MKRARIRARRTRTRRTRPSRRRLKQLPPAIRHVQTREGLAQVWRDMAADVYSPRVCQGMPKFVERLASTFFDVEPLDCASAITKGDPAFFVAFLIRLDQIDCALVNEGRGIAERTPVIRARYIIDGFRLAAEEQLCSMGGTWPPATASDAPPA